MNSSQHNKKISKSTVSKALNHCYGVSSEVRDAILNCEEYRNIATRAHTNAEIYIIVPEVILGGKKIVVSKFMSPETEYKLNIYSKPSDTSTIVNYLGEAIMLNSKAIIIAGRYDKDVASIIESLTDSRLIININDYNNQRNSFFIGNDPKSDAISLAELVKKDITKGGKIVVIEPPSSFGNSPEMRFETFTDIIKSDYTVENIHFPNVNQKQIPSVLARSFNSIFQKEKVDAIISFNGFCDEIAAAIYKASPDADIKLYAFQNPDTVGSDNKYIKGVVYEDVTEQIELSVKMAEEYIEKCVCPENKFTFTKSRVKEY